MTIRTHLFGAARYDHLREVLDAALCRLSPKSDMARAIAYGTKRRPALSRLLRDGRLEIDNNIAERAARCRGRTPQLALRRLLRGRRACGRHLHSHPDLGLRRGRLCRANGVDPQAYIADVIAPFSQWDELMPWIGCRQQISRLRKQHELRPPHYAYLQSGRHGGTN